jgi:hypothetical protein
MRREIFIHFAFLISFLILTSIFKNYLSLSYWPFWLGGIIGTILPDIDHFIYVFFLNPQELTSQRVSFLLKRREVWRIFSLLSETRAERKDLVFHTFLAQIIFLILAFWVITSSNSLLGMGAVLGFSLHLSVDQLVDIFDLKNLGNWGKLFSFDFDYKLSIWYTSASFLLICIIGFLM